MHGQSDELASVLPPGIVNSISGSSAAASVGDIRALPEKERIFVMDAYAKGLSTMWYFFVAMAVICVLASVGIGMFWHFQTLSCYPSILIVYRPAPSQQTSEFLTTRESPKAHIRLGRSVNV